LDYEESVKKLIEEGRKEKAAGKGGNATTADGKGFLSLTSKVDLNSMDVDLSAQLKPRSRDPSSSQQQQQQRRGSNTRTAAAAAAAAGEAGYPRVPATRGEVRAWDRSGRYSRKVIATPPLEAEADAIAARRAEEEARYEELKKELYTWAVGLTAACFAATLIFYGRDVAASYGLGALGGLVYLRLLNRSMDGIGAGGMGAALGSNRLLIPLILALGYNRYNIILAEDTGLTLQLLPILVGFFTYKGAVIARQSLLLFGDLAAPYTSNSSLASSLDSVDEVLGSEEEDDDIDGNSSGGRNVTNVDRAFAKKILQG
jgi:ATP synthase protein I